MKTLLIAEYRDQKLLSSYNELIAFSREIGGDSAMFLVGDDNNLPAFGGNLYLADAKSCGEFNPDTHRQLLLGIIEKEQPEMIVLPHSSYGWDLAPRIAYALKAAQISEVIEVVDSSLVVPACNAKMRRKVKAKTEKTVVTLQAGAFSGESSSNASPTVIKVEATSGGSIEFIGYEEAAKGGIDLDKTEVIVSAGRGIGKPENIDIIARLAKSLGGEYGASRPVVDAEWAEHNRQVGTTGQTVSPKLYMACGISGAIQHLAGMKKSEFIVGVNTDKDAPIGELADIMVIADLKQFLPVLTEKIEAL